ncbi:MAG: protein translocase subunit SecF [Coriobacteriia bacterium]|nr:protein translocase subunit SecF [Coriobacteriia bacterium]
MRRPYIDFLGYRMWFLGFSAALMLLSIAVLGVQGLTFGIEFQGGTAITFTKVENVQIEDMREAFQNAGVESANIQSTENGFLVRTTESDPDVANDAYASVVAELGLPSNAGEVTTIGPGWGANITNRALMALALSLLAILVYTALRFEYKMSLTAVAALVHDVVIVLGVYALLGREVTPNTIAALLTIMGYSLYDTIVVFHRIRENSRRVVRQTFMQMANDSINQVIVRSINTSVTSLIPPLMLLFFGGTTLNDFAFALVVGLISGAYSSVGVASPIYAIWKEREPKFRALKKKYEQQPKAS